MIAGLTTGLAYIHFAPGPTPVYVPAGAKAGDIALQPCTYTTEAGGSAAECGTLIVPENRANSRSRLIALPITRIRARSEHPAEPIFNLYGGPGQTNMVFRRASRLTDNHDVVLVGYRGVDGSISLECPEVIKALQHSADLLSDATFRAFANGMRSCADRFTNRGVDLAGYNLAQRVDDLDAARVGLGYDRIDLLSESAGTRTAMIYAWRYPESTHRSVMLAVNPPGHFLWNPEATDDQIRHYAALCSRDEACRKHTDDLAATMRTTAANIPDRWGFLPIKAGNVRLASFYGLMHSTSAAGILSAPTVLDAWLSAASGDASGFWFMSFMADLTLPHTNVWGEMAATAMADARVANDYFSSGGDPGSILGNPATESLWAGGRLVGAWPARASDDEYSRVQTSSVQTLLIGGSVDFATPPRSATEELLPSLPNGHQVVLAELGHTGDFWTYQPEASTRLLNAFFDSGTVDDSLYTYRAMDFTPGLTLIAVAKGIAGMVVGVAILAVLSLVWMARRVRQRGSVGTRTSAFLRSVYPLVLGLGGWFVGALVALTTLPGVPIDDQLVTVLSVGVATGLGIYFAWVHHDWSRSTKSSGFAAALLGASLGAWLAFNAADGLLAPLSAILGASVGSNLSVLALDIWWDRRPRDRFAAINPHTTPEVVPTPS